MSGDTYLTRVCLRRDVPAAALREVLLPQGAGQRSASAHRLIWTLFADSSDRARDFLWHEGRSGEFYLLSERIPADQHGLFSVEAPRVFAPSLAPGDRLSFLLRVNATVARSSGPNQRGKPCDIVMDALKDVPVGSRAESRKELLVGVATRWLSAREAKSGFALAGESNEADGDPMHAGPVRVRGYHVERIDRGRGAHDLSIGVLDLEGQVEVRDPGALIAAIKRGFGRGKAFGCGLMLIKRM